MLVLGSSRPNVRFGASASVRVCLYRSDANPVTDCAYSKRVSVCAHTRLPGIKQAVRLLGGFKPDSGSQLVDLAHCASGPSFNRHTSPKPPTTGQAVTRPAFFFRECVVSDGMASSNLSPFVVFPTPWSTSQHALVSSHAPGSANPWPVRTLRRSRFRRAT